MPSLVRRKEMAFDPSTHHQIERSLAELQLERYVRPRNQYRPSPETWQDQLLYFLMVDRFSDGNEQGTVAGPNGDTRNSYLDNDAQPVATGTTPLFQFARGIWR